MTATHPPSRCPWCGTDPLYVAYHDEEWGLPLRDERRLFERHVDGEPRRNAFATMDQVPAATPESEAMSRALKRLGFRVVGPTICCALMQSAGLVDDHLTSCFRHGAAAAQATDQARSS